MSIKCKLGFHRNTSITACMTKHCLDCGKVIGHINEPKERRSRTMRRPHPLISYGKPEPKKPVIRRFARWCNCR